MPSAIFFSKVGAGVVTDKKIAATASRNFIQAIAERAFEPRDVASLVFFRMAFGAILLWEVVVYFLKGWIDHHYLLSRFHFTYLGFGWVRPWPGDWLIVHFVILGVAALFLTVGLWTRVSAALLFVGWSYVLLLDKAVYLNHFYLICLISFLLLFVPTHRAFSLDARRHPGSRSEVVPAVALWVLRTQIAIPYVFGAIAKLNGDWLQGQPLQMWMPRMTHVREVLPIFGEPWLALVFSYGGFLLDLLVVPLLLWRRTRMWAFGVAIAFHLFNALVFNIGIFPWFMICATTLFFDPDWPRRIGRLLAGGSRTGPNHERELQPAALSNSSLARRASVQDGSRRPLRRLVLVGVGVWFFFQLTLPFRHLLYPGDVDWTEEGSRFAWRMMLCDKTAALGLYAIDRQTRSVTPIDPREYLNAWQLDYLGRDPDLLVQFSQFMAEEFRQTQHRDVEIHAHAFCSLNGRRPQFLVDPEIDLASQSRSLRHQPWIIPLQEPLPDKPWDQPPNTWGKTLKLPDPQ